MVTNKKDRPNIKNSPLRWSILRLIWLWGTVVVSTCLTACLSSRGLNSELTTDIVAGDPFKHRIYFNRGADLQRRGQAPKTTTPWHIYLHGDGSAATISGGPSRDPTPRESMVQFQATQDSVPAAILGRPCYYHTQDRQCHPIWWTIQRYSEPVVTSLQTAIQQLVPADQSIVLIGYSGGATLATLLAARLPQVCGLVTIAGNLQVERWLDHHQFSPLQGLDPETQPALPSAIRQLHIAGEQDQQIPWPWIAHFSNRQAHATFELLLAMAHDGPWPLWWTLGPEARSIAQDNCVKVTFPQPPTGLQ